MVGGSTQSSHTSQAQEEDSELRSLDVAKLIVCNINPTRHETTLSMEIVLLIYAFMMDMPVSLPSVMIYAMNTDPTKSKNHLLLYPMKWREEEEEVAPPIPPPAAPTDIPAPFAPSSTEPSRRDLMRALRRNERIMLRLEQLMLMLHPGLDTSRLEQISSPEIS
ncbi:hypothetical protein PIB30_080723 [Stylosanthes scabra]|uniref:Uncharacterized protein n=1 Tax=Stylosanthes scabra TaxID=79078 RepID=A0ABU6RRD1_9FABA|nr:hypothetical protein [Stylosanthes scabra]